MLDAQDFIGDWQIDRTITDRLAAQTGNLVGTATMSVLAPDKLLYEESGTFRLGDGPAMQATRRYHWHFTEAQVDMVFADGAPFHSFVPEGYVAGTEHPCGDDIYNVRYDFIPWPCWCAVWVVRGPRKDYTSVTEFTR